MFDWLDPYSAKNLRKKASITNEHFVKMLLEIAANQLESGKIGKVKIKKAVKLIEVGLWARNDSILDQGFDDVGTKVTQYLNDSSKPLLFMPSYPITPNVLNYWIKAAEILNYKFVLNVKIKPETIEIKNKMHQAQLEEAQLALVPNQ